MDFKRAICRYQSPNGRGRCPARQDTAIEESFSGLVSREEGGEEKGGHQRAAKEIQKWMLEWKWREREREKGERLSLQAKQAVKARFNGPLPKR